MARVKPAGPDVNCCDLKALAGDDVRIGKDQEQCVVRSRSGVTRTSTSCQRERRIQFAAVPALWRTLSPGQKQAWSDFAAITPLENLCGDTFFESNYRFFVRINGILVNFGNGFMLSDPPANYTAPAIDIPVDTRYTAFCFYPRPLLVAEFDIPAGQGLTTFALMGANYSLSTIRKNGNLLFSTTGGDEPLYGDPPDPGIDPTILPQWLLSIRSAWKAFRKFRDLQCQTPVLGEGS